jgi:hypothetical protein
MPQNLKGKQSAVTAAQQKQIDALPKFRIHYDENREARRASKLTNNFVISGCDVKTVAEMVASLFPGRGNFELIPVV